MKNIALIGAGSLGTILGALLTKNGIDLTLIDANKEHVDTLNKSGATVIGKMDLKNVPVRAITPDEMQGIYDIVFLLTKQTTNDIALKQLETHLSDDSVVCTLQNGIPEESVSKILGAHRVVGGTVGWGASWIDSGVSELTSEKSSMRIDIGEQDGKITPRIKEIADILSLGGECIVVENLAGIRWSKLIQNATLSGMSAALGATYAQILDDEKATAAAAHVGNEMVKIVRARNIELIDLVPGWSYYSLAFDDEEGLERAKQWLREYFKPHRALKASMLQDMEKGRACEIDHIVGTPCQWGKKLNIETPVCQTIVDIVKGFEAGTQPFPSMADLDKFDI